ncbi:MAG: hypothetical protein EOM35_02380 [Negativicutes bacterium]|nr:hypothetical protein [Negativicutes bacterium]
MLTVKDNLMIDIETLSTAANAHILSIGICSFTLEKGAATNWGLKETYRLGLIDQGRKIDTDTLAFWLKQPKKLFKKQCEPEISLPDALKELSNDLELVKKMSFDGVNEQKQNIWCNGASFDFTILRDAFAQYGIPLPWKYYQENCMRSIKALFNSHIEGQIKQEVEERLKSKGFELENHDALSDAIWQAEYVSAAVNKIRTYKP